MRNRLAYFLPMLDYLGALFWVFGFVLLVPLVVLLLDAGQGRQEVCAWSFLLPAAVSLAFGFLLKRRLDFGPLDARRSMLLCALGWIGISAVAALPFCIGIGASYLDAYFEAVSGFTTTGITTFTGLDQMPRSILFWRSLMQWLGGLGILTFFLAVAPAAGAGHSLFSAESHKIYAKRPAPSIFRTLQILWAIYTALTAVTALLLLLEGLSLYDAVLHAFTALSTGGFAPHDASIDYYRQAGYSHYVLIEYTIILGMVFGGTNFFIHYRALTGDVRALWDNFEVKLWWLLLLGTTGLVMLDHFVKSADGLQQIGSVFRYSFFQVVAIATTTGFATKDIGAAYFPSLARLLFLVLMVVGGCVGSTGGGIKVLRVGVLLKMVGRQVQRVVHGRGAVIPVLVDGEPIEQEEVRRIAALFFAWVALLAFGAGVTALLSSLGPLEAASGMFSALGNIGPSYISVEGMSQLHPVVKITYIVGMLAGRLEILPILLLFSRRAWR